jgi:hypothetical protein
MKFGANISIFEMAEKTERIEDRQDDVSTRDPEIIGRRATKIILPPTFLRSFQRSIYFSCNQQVTITMAAVYKAVNKKKARQSIEDDSDNEMEAGLQELLNDADDTTDSEEEDEEQEEDRITAAKKMLAQGFMPKTRVLILTSRGVTHR